MVVEDLLVWEGLGGGGELKSVISSPLSFELPQPMFSGLCRGAAGSDREGMRIDQPSQVRLAIGE